VVDGWLEPQPVGVAGELLIGGEQVGRGYAGRAGLTAERFVADPFSGVPGARLYRTGDLARWRADGTLEFLGRADQQVKIRGMRVELGEIEAALVAMPGVAQGAVALQGTTAADRRLVAYVVPSALSQHPAAGLADGSVISLDGLLDLEALRAGLKRVLPEHMVPSGYVGLSRLPLTASAKLDRRALPSVEGAVVATAYVAPRDATETAVSEVFAQLLGLSRVGVLDEFFDLGGHSLLAVRLVAALAQATGKELSVRTVFEHPTVEGLAQALRTADGTTTHYQPFLEFAPGRSEQPLRKRPESELYCIHPAAGASLCYAGLVQPLAATAQLVGLQGRGWEPGQTAFPSYEEMCTTYVEALKQRAGAAAIPLMGWSLGGFVAHDVACRLAADGWEVPYLVILDSDNSGQWQKTPQAFEAWADATLRSLGDDDDTRGIADRLRALGEAGLLPGYVPQFAADPADLERRFRIMHQFSGLLDGRAGSTFYPGPALVIRAADTKTRVADPALGWEGVCGSVDTIDVPFEHNRLLDKEAARQIGEAMATWIDGLAARQLPAAHRSAR